MTIQIKVGLKVVSLTNIQTHKWLLPPQFGAKHTKQTTLNVATVQLQLIRSADCCHTGWFLPSWLVRLHFYSFSVCLVPKTSLTKLLFLFPGTTCGSTAVLCTTTLCPVMWRFPQARPAQALLTVALVCVSTAYVCAHSLPPPPANAKGFGASRPRYKAGVCVTFGVCTVWNAACVFKEGGGESLTGSELLWQIAVARGPYSGTVM